MPDPAAVEEPVTVADSEAEAPPPVDEQAPETETPETPEPTDDAPPSDPPTTRMSATELAALLAELPEEELTSIDPIKSVIARKGESERRRAEAQTAQRIFAERQQYAGTDAVVNDLAAIAREAELDERGNPTIDRSKVESAAARVLERGVGMSVQTLSQLLDTMADESFTLTPDEQDQIEAAKTLFHRNPLDPSPLYRSFLRPFVRSQTAALREEIAADERKKVQREFEAKLELERAKLTGDSRRSSTSATPLAGTPNGRPMTLTEIDAEPMAQWMARPADERSRLIREAEAYARQSR